MSDTTHGPHTPDRPFGAPLGKPLTLKIEKGFFQNEAAANQRGLETAKATVAAFNRMHPVDECGPSCETEAPAPPYADDSWTQKSSIQSEPYTFLTHLNRKLDRLVNERRKLDAMRNTLQSDIDVLHQLIRISS